MGSSNRQKHQGGRNLAVQAWQDAWTELRHHTESAVDKAEQ